MRPGKVAGAWPRGVGGAVGAAGGSVACAAAGVGVAGAVPAAGVVAGAFAVGCPNPDAADATVAFAPTSGAAAGSGVAGLDAGVGLGATVGSTMATNGGSSSDRPLGASAAAMTISSPAVRTAAGMTDAMRTAARRPRERDWKI